MICTWRKYKTPAGAITKMLATSVRLWEENLQWKVRKVKPTKVERERHYHFHTTFGEAKPHWYTTSRPATGHLASKYPVGLCHKTCTIKIHQSIERPSTSASRHYLTHTHLQGAFITVLELGKMQCNMYTSQHGHRQNFVLRRANPLYEGEEGGGAGQLCWGGWGGGGQVPLLHPPANAHASQWAYSKPLGPTYWVRTRLAHWITLPLQAGSDSEIQTRESYNRADINSLSSWNWCIYFNSQTTLLLKRQIKSVSANSNAKSCLRTMLPQALWTLAQNITTRHPLIAQDSCTDLVASATLLVEAVDHKQTHRIFLQCGV